MKPWEEARRILPIAGAKIVAVGLVAGTKILTGKRRDNGKWTCPGGHMDQGETLVECAVREVKEETGIDVKPEDLELVSAERVISHRVNKEFSVFCFVAHIPKTDATSENDPDKEVIEWKWVALTEQSPELKPENRHAYHDSVLCHLGICGSHGRLRKKSFSEKRLQMTSDDYTEGTTQPITENPDGQAIDNILK